LPRNLRSDARDNRDRILDATRSAFVTDGVDVPIREIARRAEVGPATVYRHFPTKQMLVAEAFTDQMLAWRSILDEGLADPMPGTASVLWLRSSVAASTRPRLHRGRQVRLPARDGFRRQPLLLADLRSRTDPPCQGHRPPAPDAVLEDLILMIMANDGIHASTPAAGISASRRFAALMIQAFQASPS